NGTDLGSRRFLIAEDLAVANVYDAMRVLGDIVLVGNEDDGVALIVQTIEQRHNFHAGLRVQVAGGLVRQNDGRTVDQGASNGHALPLSAGQFVGLVVHSRFHSHRSQCLASAFKPLFGRHAGVDQREFDVVQRGGAGQQV